MIAFEIAALLILLFSFFYGAIKLWKKGNPLYFQIIICAIGCTLLFNIAVLVMTFCNVNETDFNTSIFGLFGCNLFLLCANRGALEKLFDAPNKKCLIISIFSGVIEFAFCFVVAILYYGFSNPAFYIFLIVQLPLSFVVYFVTKRLLSPQDDLGLKKSMFLNDIFILLYCVFVNLDILSGLKIGILSGIGELSVALIALGLCLTCVKGAKKWNF